VPKLVYKRGNILTLIEAQHQASLSTHHLTNNHTIIIMRFSQIATLLSVAAAASAQYTYNITQAEKHGNMEKYKCLYAKPLRNFLGLYTNAMMLGTTRSSANGCPSAFTSARRRPTMLTAARPMTLLAIASTTASTLP